MWFERLALVSLSTIAFVFAYTLAHSLTQSPSAILPTHRVAVVGAGAAGASTAYFLRNFSSSVDIAITVFESSDRVGGRVRAIRIPYPSDQCLHEHKYTPESPSEFCRNNSVLVEAGASIFVTANKHLMDAARRYNLTLTSQKNSLKIHGKNPTLGIYDGSKFVFTSTGSKWNFIWDAVRRWGVLSPYRARSFALTTADQYARNYDLKLNYTTTKDFLIDGLGMDSDALSQTARQYFLSRGISEDFITEFIEPATRVNYGQNLDCNALAALICLAAAFIPSDSIAGGNSLIYENMLLESQATVLLNTQVSRIAKKESGLYSLTDSKGNHLGNYNDVVLAVPAGLASRKIVFESTAKAPIELQFKHIHVTFVVGNLSPSYFNVTNVDELPDTILTTASSPGIFNSIGTRHRFPNPYNYTLTKIFSHAQLTDEQLNSIYSEIRHLDKFEWDAYPVLSPWSGDWNTAGEFLLDRSSAGGSLVHVNAFEAAFSAMEGEVVAGANAAGVIMAGWSHKTPAEDSARESEVHMEDEL
ncbi:hypothetical protein HDU82_004541 [Entophlyctis luteolus]|nr:hypothetical protein HDU82_004541 [Entophlyctis luteolus]